MAAAGLEVVKSSGAVLQGVAVAATAKEARVSTFRSRGGQTRGLVLPPGKSFRAFRIIQKSPRLSRPCSRFVRISAAATADPLRVSYFVAKEQEGDVMKTSLTTSSDDDADVDNAAADDSSKVLDSVNAVLADIVDGQKYIKETGRTQPRPMKRRALVVCLALGAFRGPISDFEGRLGSDLRRSASTSRLNRTPSSGFSRTAHLISQLSFGAPKSPGTPHVAGISNTLEN